MINMGFWDDVKKARAKQLAELNGTYKEPPKPRKKAVDYHPKKEKDGVMLADIYSTYGTHNLDKWFEQGAPHLTDAIYQVRDEVKELKIQQKDYDGLKEHYDKLEQNYDELKAQYDHIAKMLETLTNNTSR
jgi:hypothetical protein